MSKLPLDLSKFKKVKSDKNTSVFQHADGHQISVAHGRLSPKLKEQLDKLPMDKSSGRQRFAEGTPAVPAEYVPGQSDPGPEATTGTNLANTDSQPQQTLAPDDSVQQAPQQPDAAAPAEQPADDSQASGPDMGTSGPQLPQAQQTAQDYKTQLAGDFAKEDVLWQQDLANQHISPETYKSLFAKKDTIGKVGTLLGLLVGGAGAGLTHQQNPVMKMMDDELQRDLDAQKQSKNNAQNWLRLQQQHQLTNAQSGKIGVESAVAQNALALNKMRQATFHALVDQTNKITDPAQRQMQQAKLGMVYQAMGSEIANANDQAAGAESLYKTITGSGTQNGNVGQQRALKSGMLGPMGEKAANFNESNSIPGADGNMIQTSLPVPQQTRNEVQAMNILDSKAQDLLDYAKANKGSLSPSVRAKGAQKAEELTSFYNASLGSGGLTAGRLKWLDEQIKKNPTSIFQDVLGNNSRVQEIKDSNATRRNMLIQSVGGKPPEQQQQDQIKVVNGVKYKRGPNGEAIKVP